MTRCIMMIPAGPDTGLTTVVQGMVRAISNLGINVGFYKPIAQRDQENQTQDHSSQLIASVLHETTPTPISLKQTKTMLGSGQEEELLELIVSRYSEESKKHDVVVIEGLVPTKDQAYAARMNLNIAKALDAKLILVTSLGNQDFELMQDVINISANLYGGIKSPRILGAIINRVGAPTREVDSVLPEFCMESDADVESLINKTQNLELFKTKHLACLGIIPWNKNLVKPRVSDIAKLIHACVINAGAMEKRRVNNITLCARSVNNITTAFSAGNLLITSGDRSDLIIATCMSVLNGVRIAGLILTGGYQFKSSLRELCQKAMDAGLPILSVKEGSFATSARICNFDVKTPASDVKRIEETANYTASYLNTDWLAPILDEKIEPKLSPQAFRYQLIERARSANKRIVLPEGTEPRTIEAAHICAQRGIAQCILLGNPEEIKSIANNIGIPSLHESIKIIDPESMREQYVASLVELRKHKNITEILARNQLADNVVLGTMMLKLGEVDGLVSGALHTTANTIRPALQLIKTDQNAKIVSSIFFMCLPEQVLVYGDCAVNPNPNAEELADIAIQSADSAKMFGIQARVAMISYSTGTSGSGVDVEKVRKATALVKQQRPDIIVDGPLQYDSAFIESVGKQKAPDSQVAGRATVYIFPDLNTGNTTYKAVQRSANVVCIGPMLQGLAKPVNDLSRGALIEDIVYTIAITAIQAT